jgi:ATP-binding cassette, subfamily C (CFTR/MRP), member 1
MLKYYAWEWPFGAKVKTTRSSELEQVQKIHTYFNVILLFVDSVPRVSFILILLIYLQLGNSLSASKGLTVMTLVIFMLLSITEIPGLIVSISKIYNACTRINNFLNEQELSPYVQKGGESSPCSSVNDDAIVLENVQFEWCRKPSCEYSEDGTYSRVTDDTSQDEESKCQDNEDDMISHSSNPLSLRVPRGSLVAIVGPIGCGKSTMLKGLLGELHCLTGSVIVRGSVAYHQQDPWILNASVLDNILFGMPYDQSKLDAVLQVKMDQGTLSPPLPFFKEQNLSSQHLQNMYVYVFEP